MSGAHRRTCWRCTTPLPEEHGSYGGPASPYATQPAAPEPLRATGTITRFTPGDQYGFISSAQFPQQQIWFHKTAIASSYKGLRTSDTVSFIPASKQGRLRATDIQPVRLTTRSIREASGITGGVITGALLGAALGPVGATIGAVVGGIVGGNRPEKTSTCLHCNRTGYATGQSHGRTGYRCSECGHRWSQRD